MAGTGSQRDGAGVAAGFSGAFFESILEASPDCIAILTPDGVVEFMNHHGLVRLGVGAAADAFELDWSTLWPQDHKGEVDRAVGEARAGRVARFRAFRPSEQGAPRWWDTTVSPVFDGQGRAMRLLATSRDVTSQIEAKSFLDTIIEYVPAVLFAKDARDGRYVLLNLAAEEVFGMDREDMLGKTDHELFPQAQADPARASDRQVVETGSVHEDEEPINTRDQGVRFFRTSRMATYGDEGPRHVIGIAQDVTEQRQTAEALRAAAENAAAANQSKSEFLANMSHEIRTPLNGVVGVTDVLARTSLTPDQREMVELIRSSGMTLERLLSDVLDLARIESGKIDIQAEPYHLAQALRSVSALLAMRAEEKGVALVVEMAPEAEARFVGDVVRVKQIATNLISNAIKFTERGEVRLEVDYLGGEDNRFRFSVRDTGVGFGPEQKARVFSRFEQADGSITRRFGGTGLGLAISRQLADLMGGSLDCDSTPGVGSVFWVDLPMVLAVGDAALEPDDTAPLSLDADPAADEGRPLRVLLADDHPANRKVVELILAQVGVELVSVENGLQAVEAFRESAFDAVLMDMQMPVMDGLTATREIRRHEQAAGAERTPVIMLTANALAEHLAASQAAGADRHLTKPIAADKLLKALMDVAEESALRDAA